MSYFSVGVILDANMIDNAVEEILQAYQQELKELGDNGVVTQDEKNTIKNEVIKRFTSIQLEPFCEDIEKRVEGKTKDIETAIHDYNFQDYVKIKDMQFVKLMSEGARQELQELVADALLTADSEWHAPEDLECIDSYSALIEKENPENYFVLVDCHI